MKSVLVLTNKELGLINSLLEAQQDRTTEGTAENEAVWDLYENIDGQTENENLNNLPMVACFSENGDKVFKIMPTTSPWGLITGLKEIAENTYRVITLKSQGIMINKAVAKTLLPREALNYCTEHTDFYCFDNDDGFDIIPLYELKKQKALYIKTNPSNELKAIGQFLIPQYFGELPRIAKSNIGTTLYNIRITNGVDIIVATDGAAIAVHKEFIEYYKLEKLKKHANSYGKHYLFDMQKAELPLFELCNNAVDVDCDISFLNEKRILQRIAEHYPSFLCNQKS